MECIELSYELLFLEHDKAAIGTKQTEIRDKGQ
jgi:hypothetical protein